MANQYGVRKRGNRWLARPYIPGRGHAYAGTHDSPEEATKAAIAKIEAERKLPPNKETVATFASRWTRDFPRPKESTNDAYDQAATRFADHLGPAIKLHEVTVPEAMEWARKHPYDAPKLNAMFNDARRSGLILGTSPFSALGISKGRGRKDIIAITSEELDLLAEIAFSEHGKRYGPVFRSVVLFAAYTTMRPSEIFGLDRGDIRDEEIVIERQFYKRRIQEPKKGPRRLPFIPPQAAQAISDLPRFIPAPVCKITKGEILFPGKEGQRVTQPALHGYWKPVRAAFEAKLSEGRRAELCAVEGGLDFYSLRHFGATFMVEKGVESWVVAKMMGHQDGGRLVEKVYGHPRDEVARERLQQAFATNVQPLQDVSGREAESA